MLLKKDLRLSPARRLSFRYIVTVLEVWTELKS